MQMVVGIGEMGISNRIEDTIITFALASCVGVVAYSPSKKIGGIIHIALPKPPDMKEGINKCCYYASTGIPYFFNTIFNNYGCDSEEIIISIYGGAKSIKSTDMFNIGAKNLEEVKKIIEFMNLKIQKVDIGKYVSRTIELDICNGQIDVAYQNIII